MAVIDFHPEDIGNFLREITEANSQLREAAEKISQAAKDVEPKWNGDAQKAFFRFYSDWRKGIDLHTGAMEKSAVQLRRMMEEQEAQ